MTNGIFPAVNRIITIGDLHGDFEALIICLQKANVINDKYEWTGGNTWVVQLGDIVDGRNRIGNWKADDELKILSFLENLDEKAKKFRGKIVFILGNHEIMNTFGNFSYASSTAIKKMGGVQARRKLFEVGKGRIANFYSKKCFAVAKIGSWIFCHGGIVPSISSAYQIPQLNKIMKDYLNGKMNDEQVDKFYDLFFGNNGVLTYRGYGNVRPNCNFVYSTLKNLDGGYLVIGHTPQDYINSKCNRKLWRVDTGMSQAFGRKNNSRIQCLEINNDGQSINIIK
jgi:hypothetical protein